MRKICTCRVPTYWKIVGHGMMINDVGPDGEMKTVVVEPSPEAICTTCGGIVPANKICNRIR